MSHFFCLLVSLAVGQHRVEMRWLAEAESFEHRFGLFEVYVALLIRIQTVESLFFEVAGQTRVRVGEAQSTSVRW